ncbi:hypothetical protein GTW43_00020 [Streptomyces sp. SID5785]|uniref:SAV_2336 N-terminal domain-related protein n=1 Tax=Streptomyces sp. SID5785 TaxID=2690309 RepID=UPI0013613F52|nr:hypothetical protein [Streptomyces sp. SID5785]
MPGEPPRHDEGPGPLARLVETLAAAGTPLDSREIADALWLARVTRDTGLTGAARDSPPTGTSVATALDDPLPRSPEHPSDPANSGPSAAPPQEPHGARRPPSSAPGPATLPDGTTVALADLRPAAPAPVPVPVGRTRPAAVASGLAALPAVCRALRPLRTYRPPGRAAPTELDETATAEESAGAGMLRLVRRPVRRRTADLVLLMDGTPAMAVWDGLLADLRRACVQVGAFRDVVVQYLHPLGTGLGVTAQPGLGHVLRPAQEMTDPGGQRVHLLLSDCTGPLWHDGTFQRLLGDWVGSAPLAVLQPLPQRFWPRTALPVRTGTLIRRQGPYHQLGFHEQRRPGARTRLAPPPPQGPYVPVLTPTPTALGTWSRLVAAEGGLRLRGAAAPLTVGPPAAGADAENAEIAEEAERLLVEFDETASPAARDLAVHLAAAPLALPVMRLVQRTMQPGSGAAELAEVLLGGLVAQRPPGDGPGREQERRTGPWFDFKPRVRGLLLERLSAGEAALVLKHTALFIERAFGRAARNYPAAVVAYLEGTGRRPATGTGSVPEPFATVSDLVLRHFERGLAELPGLPALPGHPLRAAEQRLHRYETDGNAEDLLEALRLLRTPRAEAARDGSRLYVTALLHAWQQWRDPRRLDEAEDVARRAVDALAAGPAPDAERLGAARTALARVLRTRGEQEATGTRSEQLLDEALAQLELALDLPGLTPETRLACAVQHTDVITGRVDGAPRDDLAHLRRSVRVLSRLTRRWADGTPPAQLYFTLGRTLLLCAVRASEDSDERRDLARQAVRELTRSVERTEEPAGSGGPPARYLHELARAHAIAVPQFQSAAEGAVLKRAADAARAEGDTALEALARGQLGTYLWKSSGGTEPDAAEAEMKRALSLLRPGDPQRAELLVSYGQMLLESQRTQHESDDPNAISEAVNSLREAVADTAPSHPTAVERRLLLAAALRRRYGAESMIADLYEACWTLDQALRDTEEPTLRAAAWLELGGLHGLLARHTREREEWVRADEAYGHAAREAEAARDPRTAARALHGRAEVLEYLAGPARALVMYRAARERWARAPGADPAEIQRTDDRIRRLDGTQ